MPICFGGPAAERGTTTQGDGVWRKLLAGLVALVPLASPADDAPSPLGMSRVRTPDLELVYFDSLRYLEPHTIRTYTNSLSWQKRMLGWTPSQPTTVLLKDLADFGNAAAISAPRNLLIFDVAPLSRAFETFTASERMYSLMNHELVHVAMGDVADEEDRRWRRFLLGKVSARAQNPESLLYSYLTVPRFTAPRWLNEGAAVFLETWMSGGLGRAQGGYDEMVFRAMVRDGAPFYDPLGLVSRGTRVDFQVGANAYLYGTRFITWLSYAHSPEKVLQWLRRDEGSRRYYADQFEHVFGLPVEKAWQDWIAFERDFQAGNLAEVRKHPITPTVKLVAGAVGSTSRVFVDEAAGRLYGAFRYPGTIDYVGSIDLSTGERRRLADVKRAILYKVTSLAWDPAGGTLFYANDNIALRDLMAVDVKTGEERMLIEDARVGEFAFNPADRSLWGVRHENGLASLVRIAAPYDKVVEVLSFPYENIPYDLDISPDGKLLSASVSQVDTEQFLRVWRIESLLAGEARPLSEYRFGQSVPESFVFSRDGRHLYGSSYYTGVSNIFRYEVATGAVEAVSNAESGFFRPAPLADGRLLVFDYTGEGFVPAIIDPKPVKDASAIRFLGTEVAEKHPVVKSWQVPPASTVDEEKLVTARGPWDPRRDLVVKNGLPVLQGYKDSIGVGYRLSVEDPIGFAQVAITAAFTPDTGLASSERAHLDLNWNYLGWRADLTWNKSDFYDLFGPTKKSRKGLGIKVGHDNTLIYDEPRRLDLKTEIAYYDKIDALPDYQNVDATFERLYTAEVSLRYKHFQRSLGAVDDEKGLSWEASLSANRVNGETIPQLRGGLDFGFPLPLDHSSVWLRSAAGVADGDRRDPFANFFFGGFGNNYVDSGAIKRYREHYAMPGFGINEVSGRSFVKTLAELNLPPRIFESVGTPSFYLAWLRPAVFASALRTDPQDSRLRRDYSSLGAQVDLRFTVLHWYEMTLSVGYAVGYRGATRAGDEFMISLKIL